MDAMVSAVCLEIQLLRLQGVLNRLEGLLQHKGSNKTDHTCGSRGSSAVSQQTTTLEGGERTVRFLTRTVKHGVEGTSPANNPPGDRNKLFLA